jgi:signal transduction histidine kinase/ligand-binding sensor domain-containing protein
MWIGTYNGGVNRFDRNKNEFRNFRPNTFDSVSIGANNVTCIVEDKKGIIWIGTWGGGLNRFDRGSDKFIRIGTDSISSDGLSSQNIRCMTFDRNGLLWIGTWDGLNVYNPSTNQLIYYKHDPKNSKSISGNRIVDVFEDHKGNIWVSTFSEGLNNFVPATNEFIKYTHSEKNFNSLSSNQVGQIAEYADGNLLISTRGGSLNRFDVNERTFTTFKSPEYDLNYSTDKVVYSVYCDRMGGIWMGTTGGGVNYYNPQRYKFTQYNSEINIPNRLNNPMIRAICEGSNSDIWIGTDGGGLNLYNKKNKSYLFFKHNANDEFSISHNSVLALLEDSRGNLWVGTDGGGLDLYDRRNNRFIHHRSNPKDINSISSNYVMVIYEDLSGNLWIGTAGGGLNRYDPANNKFFVHKRLGKKKNELSGNYIWSIIEDKQRELWIGTWGAGLNRFNPETNKNKIYRYDPTNPKTLNNNTVLSIYEDNLGNIWLGTNGGGLNRFDRETETFTHFTEKDGLPNNVVYGVLEDANGNLWLSTNKGLSCFNPGTRNFKNYDIRDGLQNNEFNQGAYSKNKNGGFYFGGINGFNSFYPEQISMNKNIPQIVLTDFKVFDKNIHLNEALETVSEIQLSYTQNFFSFEFAALDYSIPEKNQYMYILEGYDKDWIQSGTRRYAAYTNLDGGNYVFRVKASNNDGIWNTEGRSVKIIIVPPFWKTWWFRTIATLIVATFSFMIIQIRIGRLKKEKLTQQELSMRFIEFQEKERQRIASELHDSLGQNLLIIKNSLRQCEGKVSGQNIISGELSEISELAQEAIDEVREISYDLHPHTLDRLGLQKGIQSSINKFSQVSQVKIISDIDEINNLFTPIEEIHIFRIIQEALNNVLKHSDASECKVIVKNQEYSVNIQVIDNGKGFDVNNYFSTYETIKGFGVSNITERVKIIKGELKIQSSSGNGTTISVSIPIINKNRL